MSDTRILIVEDENVIAKDLWTCLTRRGYVIPAVVRSGEEALRQAQESSPDVVLMDVVLKGNMDGIQVAEQLKERLGIPVIFLTAYSDDNTVQRARITEPYGYILKPFEDKELYATIEIALYKRSMERKRQASEARFRSLIENANDLIAILDTDQVLQYVSPSVTRILGYQPQDMIGKSLLEFVAAESVSLVSETFGKIRRLPQVVWLVIEFLICHSNGSQRIMSGYVTDLLDDPAIKGLVINCHDITELKQAEGVLLRRNRDLALLNQISQTLMSTLDLDQVTERLVRALMASIGTEGGSTWLLDKEGTGDLICQSFHPDPELPLDSLHLKAGEGIAGWVAQTGQTAIVPDVSSDMRFSLTIDALTGFHTVSVLAVPLQTHGKLIGVLEAVNKQGAGFDEHDRVLAETIATSAAIAIENASLVEALRLQTSRLEAHNEELDAFAHTVAHDLKNPIGLITSLAGLLELDYAGLTEAERQGLVRSILRSAHKMDNIIEELLLLAGVRKTTVQAWPLDMLAIVGEAKQRLEDMIEKYQAQITLANVDQWPVVLGYAPWVEEVWVNYISNALKYGGHPSLVELGATIQSDGFVRFWVRDNGPGLSTKDQAQLFTPFTRLSQARARGQGLGLSIVRRIVEKLGGQVGVESQGVPGQGSVFYFTLPVSPHHDSQAGETGGA